jgi:hypothetical protein
MKTSSRAVYMSKEDLTVLPVPAGYGKTFGILGLMLYYCTDSCVTDTDLKLTQFEDITEDSLHLGRE